MKMEPTCRVGHGPRLARRTFAAGLLAAATGGVAMVEGSNDHCFLFSSFRGNGEDGLHLAYSHDGYVWKALRGDTPFLAPQVGQAKLMRDPCIARGPNGLYHMVWTVGWWERTIGYANSKDLVHWSEQLTVPAMVHEPAARNAWAPELLYDPVLRKWVVFWATTIPGHFADTEQTGDEGCNHRIYYTTTRDFREFTPTRLLIDPGFECIDATIVRIGGVYRMVLKDETLRPVARKNLRMAVARRVEGPYGPASDPFTPNWVEGPSLLKVGEDWIVYFDCYTKGRYGAMRTRDFRSWTDVSDRLSFPKGTRHGTAFRVPRRTLDGLIATP